MQKRRDLSFVLQLAKELTNFHHRLDDYYQTWQGRSKKYKKWLLQNLGRKNFKILIAKNDKNEIIAYGIATIKKPTKPTSYIKFKKFGFIEAIYVKDKFRRKGIGKEIFKKFLEWFKSNGVRVIELTVHEKNKLGIVFWKKHGFFEFYKGMRREL
jgi:GNAT superfamily N-acetyltransferase